MKKSKNEKVNTFLEETMVSNHQQYCILQELREIVFRIFPEITEEIMYGGIMFSLENDLGGIFPYKNHISFEFSNGFAMKDPKNILEGNGKFRRHLKIKSLSDIENKEIHSFVLQTSQKI